MTNDEDPSRKSTMTRARTSIHSAVPVWSVSELMHDGTEAILRHDGAAYRLRITSNRKLILTK